MLLIGIGLLTEYLCDVGLEFCESYDVDVEKLTELWLTFCVNNDIDIDPTVDTLVKMERAVLKKDYKLHGSIMTSDTKQEQNTMGKHFIDNEEYPLTIHKIVTVLLHRQRV